MNYSDIIGTAGVGLILLAFFLNTFSFITKEGRLFFIFNMVGSALACYASYLINYVPFIVLEAVWCIVSIAGYFKLITKDK